MSCNHKKNPLTLMEVPENGLIYEYGVPISKSLKPATVKQVQCLKENSKWLSPDKNFSISCQISHEKSTKKPKTQKCNSVTSEKIDLSSNKVRSKARGRRYPKLEIVKSDAKPNENDENKENIRPGTSFDSTLPTTGINTKKTNLKTHRKHATECSNRTNFI